MSRDRGKSKVKIPRLFSDKIDTNKNVDEFVVGFVNAIESTGADICHIEIVHRESELDNIITNVERAKNGANKPKDLVEEMYRAKNSTGNNKKKLSKL